MKIEFRKEMVETVFHNPGADFEITKYHCEIRYDPLTNHISRIFPSKKLNFHGDPGDQAFNNSKGSCPFCPENMEKATPRFPEEFIPSGRLWVGQSYVIPNLSVYEAYNGVVIMTPVHYLTMVDFTAQMLFQSLGASLEFLTTASLKDPDNACYGSVNWNYMPCSGGSMIHPHLQVIAGRRPSTHVDSIIKECGRYYKERGTNYWEDLISCEVGGDRHLGRTGNIEWISTFAPRGLADVTAIIPGKSTPRDFDQKDITGLAEGILKVAGYYHQRGIPGFNLTLYLARKEDEGFWATLRMIGRFNTQPLAGSDISYMQTLLGDPWTSQFPEETAEGLRRYFSPLEQSRPTGE